MGPSPYFCLQVLNSFGGLRGVEVMRSTAKMHIWRLWCVRIPMYDYKTCSRGYQTVRSKPFEGTLGDSGWDVGWDQGVRIKSLNKTVSPTESADRTCILHRIQCSFKTMTVELVICSLPGY